MHPTHRSRFALSLAVALLLSCGLAGAQRSTPAASGQGVAPAIANAATAAPVALASPAGAAAEVDANAMLGGGLDVLRIVDQDKAGELWEGATPSVKKRVTRADFIGQVAQNRAGLGAPQQRSWVAINRQVMVDVDPSVAGQYLNVEFDTRFANAGSRIVREMTSFRLEPDGVWRFAGYILR